MTNYTHTPLMTHTELRTYLETHLSSEIHWLLRAATEWHAQTVLNLAVGGYHVQVYSMDSTFLHARALFEFFTKDTSRNYYGYSEYKIPPNKLVSSLYTSNLTSNPINIGWDGPLHSFIMHTQDRSTPSKLKSYDGLSMKDLNEMPVDFAKEVVRLWRDFVKELSLSGDASIQPLSTIADVILDDAIKTTANVLNNQFTKKQSIPNIDWQNI